jgi:putative FmdB family regulatory protein
MPFYEYECSHCRYYSEVLQKITDKPLKKCPSCGKNTFKKLISAPVFRLKGSGWYETDFKTDKDNKRNLAGSDTEESASQAKSESKGDGKSEGKTDSSAAAGSDAKADAKSDSKADGKAGAAKSDAKADDKRGKAGAATSGSAPKAPPATTRNVASRSARGKSATAKRARPAKRKASSRRGGR